MASCQRDHKGLEAPKQAYPEPWLGYEPQVIRFLSFIGMPMDRLARLRSFPKAPSPNDNVSAIRGNLTLEQKQLNANILAYHVAAGSKVFGSEALSGLRMVEGNVRKRRDGLGSQADGPDQYEGEMICEIEVKEGEFPCYSAV